MNYLRLRRFALADMNRPIPMIPTGTTQSGSQSIGSAHMPQKPATTRMNTGATTHQGQGFSFMRGHAITEAQP